MSTFNSRQRDSVANRQTGSDHQRAVGQLSLIHRMASRRPAGWPQRGHAVDAAHGQLGVPSVGLRLSRDASLTMRPRAADRRLPPIRLMRHPAYAKAADVTKAGGGVSAVIGVGSSGDSGRGSSSGAEEAQSVAASRGNRLPMTPNEAIEVHRQHLSAFELEEIRDFGEVWFVGPRARKVEAVLGSKNNHGFDSDSGSYLKVTNDHVAYRYETLETLGRGSFGQVVRAIDHRTGGQVALKILRNCKRFHRQAAVEVRVLDRLRRRPECNGCAVRMLDYFNFRGHVCIVFELLSINLYELSKRNSFQGFHLSLVRQFAQPIVRCLQLLHSEGIVHCDLKPENILLQAKGHSPVKVIDFGSSCFVNQQMYTYIQSRFYRAPEVLLGAPYGPEIDMFSLGCVLAEMHTGTPLFPGENEHEQLACIMEVRGLPPKSLLDRATRLKVFFNSSGHPKNLSNSKGKTRFPNSRSLQSAIKTEDKDFLDFVSRCIEWEPGNRLTSQQASEHPWLKETKTRQTSVAESQDGTQCQPQPADPQASEQLSVQLPRIG